jgi:hypothetical protein
LAARAHLHSDVGRYGSHSLRVENLAPAIAAQPKRVSEMIA